jgi:hypothetical protein
MDGFRSFEFTTYFDELGKERGNPERMEVTGKDGWLS